MTIATTTHSNPARTIPTPPLAVSEQLVFTVAEAGELSAYPVPSPQLVARGEDYR